MCAMSAHKKPPPQAPAREAKVVSIVEKIEARKMADVRRKAAAMHLRELESSVEMLDTTKALEEMDIEATLAEIDALSPAEMPPEAARAARAEMRGLRALRSCLRGDPEAGFAEWAEVVADAPNVASPFVLRARWTMGTDPAAALSDFDRAAAAEPTNPIVYARRGDCHAALGDQDRALANYRRAVALDPSLFDVHHLMARVFAARGDHAEALAAYDRAIHLAPRYVDFYLGRAETRQQLGDWKGAVGDYDRVLALDASRVDARSQRALALARAGDLGTSLDEMDALLDELDDGEDGPATGEAHSMMGHIHLMLGHHAPAIELLTRALELSPDDVSALSRRGDAYWKSRDYERALADFDRAVALAPGDPEHHGGRAKSLAGLERWPEAVLAASRAVEIAPGFAIGYFMRAIYRSHVDEDGEGVKADLTRAVELEPDSFTYRRQRATYLMDNLEVRAALVDVEKQISLRPDMPELYYERGFCKSRVAEELGDLDWENYEESDEDMQKRCTGALADLEKAIAMGLCNADLYFEWVRLHDELGDDRLATLDHALSRVPDDMLLLSLRRSVRHHAGDDAGAAVDHRRLVELGFKFPSDDWAPPGW
jgi:tetratricopeptide (TPR) repeat protein